MALFRIGKKKEEPTNNQPEVTTPTDVVLRLRQQGLSNTQIVEAMQREGYKTHQIFDAMNQADMTSGAPVEQQPQQEAQYYEPAEEGYDSRMEEIAEAIIEEKWKEVSKDINKIIEWKNETETKLSALEQRFNDLKDQFDKVHAAILGKITDYDESIREVGAEVKAMEKVFQDVLPRFTENINELSRITTGIRQKKK